jgi:predicted dehydrogenase
MLAGSGVGRPVGFWSRTASAAEEAAAEFSVDSFSDPGTMIAATQPDLVAIMTHPVARASVLKEVVDAGARHILVEKPIALTADELLAIEDLAGDRFVVVNTQYQWMPHWQRVLGLISDGALGDIRQIRASVGVDILEQGPHALSLAMASASAAGLPDPTWVVAGGSDPIDFGGIPVPSEAIALFDLGESRLTLAAGSCAPRVPGETVRAFQQQTEILGSRGRIWVSLNQGAEIWVDGSFATETTEWDRDDLASQTGLFDHIARAIEDPARQATFPTRLAAAAAQARMLFGAIAAINTRTRVQL